MRARPVTIILMSVFVLATFRAGLLSQPGITVQLPLSPRIANYQIEARLFPESKLVKGEEILTWRNTTQHDASDLRFHLYYNAWRNDHSSFLSASTRGSWGLLSDFRDNEWAFCLVKSVVLLDENGNEVYDLTPEMEYIQPDDGNPEDRTVLRVPLPGPVAGGDTVRVKIKWVNKVPRTFARTGYRGNYFFIAQWFPKIGVFQEDGTWNCHQFIQTEFFADYGVYDVKLTVPYGWIVGATGKEISVTERGDGTSTHRFYQEDVHDFVWTTSPYFSVFEEKFLEDGLPPVVIRLLLMPDHLDKKDRYFEATRMALKFYGSWFGAYPYGHLTVVDPAYGSRTGGMEYPTLFTGGTRWLSPRGSLSPESVTIHEAGHQFWYGIIGNNEFEDAWLDEGFNTYSQARVMQHNNLRRILERRYFFSLIPVLFKDIPVSYRFDGADPFEGFRNPLKLDPMSRPAYRDGPGSYRINAYSKPALMLRTLENYLGWEVFQKILSTYFERWKFKHPRPQDFFDVVNEVSQKDMNWFFDQTYRSSDVFDYAVGRVEVRPVFPPRGYVEKGDTLTFQKGEPEAIETDSAAAGEAHSRKTYRSLVYVRRWGEAIFPVTVLMTFDDGTEKLEHWDGRDRWVKYQYELPAKLVRVQVDPRQILVLDINRSNNSWSAHAPAGKAAYKWVSRWMLWVQNLMEFFAFFG